MNSITGTRLSLTRVASAIFFGAFTALAACSATGGGVDSEELQGAPENIDDRGEAISGEMAAGTTLKATTNVNFRTSPSTSASIIRVIPEGAQVTLVNGTPQNGFYKINHNGTVGWSFGKYYDVVAGGGGMGGAIPVGTTIHSTANVNLRSGPSTDYSILTVVPEGASVKVADANPQNGFYKIDYNGTVGWSSGKYYQLGQGSGGGSSSARDQAIARAKSGMGFSYYWGHARFRPEGPTSSTKGSCSGSCPNCSHSGSYGGDCSGFTAKVWQVPSSNTDLTVDSHPYGTIHFVNDTSQWKTVSRGSVLKGDAMVYNENGAGHIFVYEKGDGWGTMYSYECKGCSYGCVYGSRTAASKYHAIRRTGW